MIYKGLLTIENINDEENEFLTKLGLVSNRNSYGYSITGFTRLEISQHDFEEDEEETGEE